MQQMMCHFTAGVTQKFAIEGLNLGIFMGEAHDILPVIAVEYLAALSCALFIIMNGLAAAAYTAAGTGHNLYEVILHLATA